MNATPSPDSAEALRTNRHNGTDDFGTDENISHVGTPAAIALELGIPYESINLDILEPMDVVGADGHTWHLRTSDRFWVYASRPRTADELREYVDRHNANRFSSFFSVDRQHLVFLIAKELRRINAVLADARKAKSKRRQLSGKLTVIGYALEELTARKDADVAYVRECLGDIGIDAPQLAIH